MLVEQPVEERPSLGRHLERDAQGSMHFRSIEKIDEREHGGGVDLVGEADAHALSAQRGREFY